MCDSTLLQGKLKAACQALLTKECLMEELIADISRCGMPIDLAWSSLESAFSGLQCSKLTGRVIENGIELPIADEISKIVCDIMGNILSEPPPNSNSDFVPPKPRGKDVKLYVVPIRMPLIKLHKDIAKALLGNSYQISLGAIKVEDHSFWLRVSVLKAPAELGLVEPTYIELAKVVWQ